MNLITDDSGLYVRSMKGWFRSHPQDLVDVIILLLAVGGPSSVSWYGTSMSRSKKMGEVNLIFLQVGPVSDDVRTYETHRTAPIPVRF